MEKYAGQDLKFMVESLCENLILTRDSFEIVIVNRWGKVARKITKNDCFYDSDGRFYFTVENIQPGVWFARFRGAYEDDDYDKQEAVMADEQKLFECSVRDCCCDKSTFGDCKCEHQVRYTEVTRVSIDGADYLADCYGRYIYTSDGKRICFTSSTSQKIDDLGKVMMQMTGEEFLRKWESFDPNSEVDTIPELMHAMQGISDDKTIKQDVEDQMSEHDTENEAQDADIDSIFEDDAE